MTDAQSEFWKKYEKKKVAFMVAEIEKVCQAICDTRQKISDILGKNRAHEIDIYRDELHQLERNLKAKIADLLREVEHITGFKIELKGGL
jgi:hypothetical protein